MERAKFIIKQVQDIVGPAYLVGGSVRDVILGQEPKDYDFTTPCFPVIVEQKVKAAGRKVYGIGKKYGTIGFKVQDETGKFQYVEVTTYRKEQYEPGNRKPEVEFVNDLQSDLARRDFTINAIAFDTDFIDPFGGRLDILERKIKPVGEATDRFKEDPLRMLRAARFAAQLNFEVDPNMIGKIRKMADKILTISRERWVQELDKLLVQENPGVGLNILRQTQLLNYMLPELAFLPDEVWNEMTSTLTIVPDEASERWNMLLSYCGSGFFYNHDINDENYGVSKNHEKIAEEVARGIALRLKFSNARLDVVTGKTKRGNTHVPQTTHIQVK